MAKQENEPSRPGLGKKGSEFVRQRAEEYAKDPEKLGDLVDRARRKADRWKGRIAEVWDDLMLLFRMLNAYATGRYRRVPWQTLLLAVAAVVYFLVPFDLIPDWIPMAGFVDDAAVIAWTISSIASALEDFREWEEGRAGASPPPD